MEEPPYEKFRKQREESEREISRINQEMAETQRKKAREIPDKLDKIISQNNTPNSDEKWYKKPVGIIIIAIVGGLLLTLIKTLIGV